MTILKCGFHWKRFVGRSTKKMARTKAILMGTEQAVITEISDNDFMACDDL